MELIQQLHYHVRQIEQYGSGSIIKFNNYFHDLTDLADFNDSIYRYSYLAKNETKDIEALKGIRLTQSKIPKADKTKQGQEKRKILLKTLTF